MSSSEAVAVGISAACACGLGSILSEGDPTNPHITLRVHTVSDRAVKAMLSQSLVLPGDDSDSDDVPPPFLQHGVPFEADDADVGRADAGWLGGIRTCTWVRLLLNASNMCNFLEMHCASLCREMRDQARLAGPLGADLMLTHSLTLVALAFVAQKGTEPLAVVALGTTIYELAGRLVLGGLCNALDTAAAQAYGSGNLDALPTLFQRSVAFMAAHCVPLSGLLLLSPRVLDIIGEPSALCAAVRRFMLLLLPLLWLDSIDRPLNGVLVAQRISLPQMWISAGVLSSHVIFCWLFIIHLQWGPAGAAAALTLASALTIVATSVYVVGSGLQNRVWGTPTRTALRRWRDYASLAYPATAMRCLAAWAVGGLTLAAGLLPDPDSAVASVAVASNLYTVLCMPFDAVGIAACARVGATLGAGSSKRAVTAAVAACAVAPLLWLIVAGLLLEPHSQARVLTFLCRHPMYLLNRAAMISLFTSGAADELVERLRHLLDLVCVLVLFEGSQTILSGIVEGTGKQLKGALINLSAYYFGAVPVALVLAFPGYKGVEGLYAGLCIGPAIQAVAYGVLLAKLNFRNEAFKAFAYNRVSMEG